MISMFRFLTDIANLNRSKSSFFGADGRYYYRVTGGKLEAGCIYVRVSPPCNFKIKSLTKRHN